MTSLVRSNRRGLSRLEGEVAAELALAQAQATIAAGRVRARGQVMRVAMDELAAINMAEAAYARFAATDRAAARIELLGDQCTTLLVAALRAELGV